MGGTELTSTREEVSPGIGRQFLEKMSFSLVVGLRNGEDVGKDVEQLPALQTCARCRGGVLCYAPTRGDPT